MSRAPSLRALLEGDRPVLAAGAHDGLGARLAEEAGFDAVWASGLEISTSAGVPDANILTMTEFLAAATRMVHAGRLPVIADCDTGFGNSSNVIHMVRAYEAAGVAAVCIEDKPFPKLNSFVPGRQRLAPLAEFVGKVLAAVATRASEQFLVVARTEALIAGAGLDEALRRAEAYRRAGADVLLIHSKADTPDEVLAFLRRWEGRAPVAVVPTTYPQLSADDWRAAGASLVIHANHGLRASIAAVERTFRRIVDQGTAAGLGEPELAPLARVFELAGLPALADAERAFLRDGARPARVLVPAGGDLELPEDLAPLVEGGGPRALLDLYGQPLLARQRDAFAAAGVSELTVVGPAGDERLALPGVSLVDAPPGGSLLDTLRAGLATVDCPEDGRLILCYSDLLLAPAVAARALAAEGGLTLLVSRASFEADARPRSKRLDLVATEPPAAALDRQLDPERRFAVTAVGKHLAPDEAGWEFVGVAAFDAAGTEVLRRELERVAGLAPDQPYGAAPSVAAAGFTDLLAELLAAGVAVDAVEQHRGWLEIHDFEDYRAAIAQLGAE